MSRATLPSLEDDFSRALLGSAEADGPSSAAYAKAAAALGIGVGLGVGASLPAPAAVAVGAAGVVGLSRWSSSLGAKLLALGASGALLVGAGALFLTPPGAVQPASKTAPLERARVAAGAIEPLRAAAALPPAVRPLPASPLVAPELPGSPAPKSPKRVFAMAPPRLRASAPRVAPVLPPSRSSSGSSLAEQVQSLDRARVALGARDSAAALREIARYRSAWPNGVFLTEASVLEIEALAARGERTLAATRAADFVAAHPDSPQADRLRALIPSKKAH